MNVCMCTQKQLKEIFIWLTSWTRIFFKVVDIVLVHPVRSNCGHCPWPQSQDESYGRPFNFLVCSPGRNNNCSSGWTCQVSRRSRQNQECFTEANKAATISCPSHQSLRNDYGREKYRQKKRVLLNDPGDLRNLPPLARFSRWPKCNTLEGALFDYHWVKSLKTELRWLMCLVEVISGYYAA